MKAKLSLLAAALLVVLSAFAQERFYQIDLWT